jgi:hypothetical protein
LESSFDTLSPCAPKTDSAPQRAGRIGDREDERRLAIGERFGRLELCSGPCAFGARNRMKRVKLSG